MIGARDFPAAFRALTGTPGPVPWQREGYEILCRGEVPDALDLPTGLGKTSIVVLWLLALASGAPVPRRLLFVVNNRAVVDQATTLADGMASKLDEAADDTTALDAEERRVMVAVRDGLGLEAGQTLPVSTLRGQRADNRAWLRNPALPAIVVGTVDMIGSRLLFSGYALKRWMRSMHAGLIGMDSLIVLDESHLVLPFAHLLDAAGELARARFAPLQGLFPDTVAPFRLICLSATGRRSVSATLGLKKADLAHPWVSGRMNARKRLQVIEVDERELTQAMASRAAGLAGDDGRVIVFCNGFEQTHKVADAIAKRMNAGNGGAGASRVTRLTGQIRVRERSGLVENEVFRRFLPDATMLDEKEPAFLVANSAGEVGIDIDAEHMVSDLVPWERLVQRLGRVNRSGRDAPAMVDVFAARPEIKKGKEFKIEQFERQLAPLSHDAWKPGPDGRRDASPGALRELERKEDFRTVRDVAVTEEPFRPELTDMLLDTWSRTSVEHDSARPAIAPWLHGWVEETPDVTLVWRSHLPGRDHVDDYLRDAGPHLLETLTAPLRSVRPWLSAVLKRRAKAFPGKTSSHHDGEPVRSFALAAIISRHDGTITLDETELMRRAGAKQTEGEDLLLPGDTLILDASFGGLAPHGVLEAGRSEPPPTWDGTERSTCEYDAGEEPFDSIPRRWREGTVLPRGTGRFRIGAYREIMGDPDRDAINGNDGILRVRWIEIDIHDGVTTDTRHERSLADHREDILAVVCERCERSGLDGSLREALVQAAAHHDLGKARALWQRAARASTDKPIAKSGQPMNGRLLDGYRHEFGSVADAAALPALQSLDEPVRELALHLVAAHHGRARSWILPFDPKTVPPLTHGEASADAVLASAIAHRFEAMQHRLGHWPLAWLEAFLMASDWEASRRGDELSADAGEAPS